MENRRLYSPAYVKEIVSRYGFKFSKSLGQNFLIDGNILRKIGDAGNITSEDYVLEIGPGIGTLREELALRAKKVIAVELDNTLLPILEDTLGKYNNVEVVHGDILKIDIEKLINDKLNGGPIKVVANLPYYVTTPIIGKLIEDNLNIESIIVMVQILLTFIGGKMFNCTPLKLQEWLIIFILALLVIPVDIIRKLIFKKIK